MRHVREAQRARAERRAAEKKCSRRRAVGMLVDELEIDFAYPHAYPEQLEYMRELKDALTTADKTALLELRSFLCRTTTTLALLTSVLRSEWSASRKVVICTRTISEVERVLEELRLLEVHRSKSSGP